MQYQKRSILYGWAGSYLIVLLIPLITIFLNFHFNMKTIKTEIYSMQEIVLDNIGNEINQIMKQQINVYNYLYTDVFFQSWVSHAEKNAEFYSDAARLQKQINSYVKYTQNISCLLYMPDENYVLYNGYANNASHIYKMLNNTNFQYMGYDEWIKMLSGEYNNEFLMLDCIDGKTNERCLVYADSLELHGNKLVNVFISVPLKQIAQYTRTYASEEYFLMLYKDTVEVLHGKEELAAAELESIVLPDRGDFETDKYMGIVKKSAYGKFSYCMLVPQSDFWTKAFYIRNLFIISLLLTVVVAFVAVTFLLRRNFKPLNRLLKLTVGEKQSGNEYYQLEMTYSRLKNENKSLQQVIHSQQDALLGNYMLSVMQNRRKALSATEMEFFGLEQETSLILSGFRIMEEDDLFRFAIDNVFSELMEEEKFCRIEDGDFMWYLFFVSHKKVTSVEEKCRKQAEYLCELFQEKWKKAPEFKGTIATDQMMHLNEVYKNLSKRFLLQGNGWIEIEGLNDRSRVIVTDVLEYVEEHYADSSMNISTIADFIHKNPKYLSRIFKECTGEGILECVNRIRINKAKELISTRRYSTEEVGEMVGYASNQTFRRAFIKIVGMPPGKYMDIMCNSEK